MKTQKRSQIVEKSSSYKYNWPSIILYADAVGEKFEKVCMITLISHYDTICHEKAIGETPYLGNDEQWYNDIHQRALTIMDSGEVKVSEMIKIDEKYNVLVILDDFNIGEDSIQNAFKLLESINDIDMELLPLSKSFGEPISYSSKEVEFHSTALRKLNPEIDISI